MHWVVPEVCNAVDVQVTATEVTAAAGGGGGAGSPPPDPPPPHEAKKAARQSNASVREKSLLISSTALAVGSCSPFAMIPELDDGRKQYTNHPLESMFDGNRADGYCHLNGTGSFLIKIVSLMLWSSWARGAKVWTRTDRAERPATRPISGDPDIDVLRRQVQALDAGMHLRRRQTAERRVRAFVGVIPHPRADPVAGLAKIGKRL